MQRRRIDVTAGDAGVWTACEDHQSGTSVGMTSLVAEAACLEVG